MRFIDSIYGEIEVDIPADILICPELQRLREVRLCNVNSPYIPGGANLNRFEHAIGTAYLAQRFATSNNLAEFDRKAFIIASLLHDIITAPFGHSLEYLYSQLKKKEYEHANIRKMIFSGKTVPFSRKFYLGKKPIISTAIDYHLLDSVQNILEGHHTLSKFLSNDIDLDNIDNVFRFAYHIGIKFKLETPMRLVTSLVYSDNLLILSSDNIPYFNEWFNVRMHLYKQLLENPGDFAAKALLERCFIECVMEDVLTEYDWLLTDYEVVEHVLEKSNKTAQICMQRYMLMDLPKYSEITYSLETNKIDRILLDGKISLINDAFEEGVFLHFIKDVNKTRRVLKGILNRSGSMVSKNIGTSEDRYLIGFFSDNKRLLQKVISKTQGLLGISLNKVRRYGEQESKQIPLFRDREIAW